MVRELAERAWFRVCLACGRLLRAATYSEVRLVGEDAATHVQKRRRFHAPALIWLGGFLTRLLDTGVRVLAARAWHERESALYQSLHDSVVRVDGDGTLVLPRLHGATLASLLQDPALEPAVRQHAIRLAVVALADFHRRGFTHGDAMAENVMVDLDGGVARWFDFETVHEPGRSLAWRRADDLRALLATCVLRTAPGALEETVSVVAHACGDDEVIGLLAARFDSAWQRPLAFHLGQAGLSLAQYRTIARLLRPGLRGQK